MPIITLTTDLGLKDYYVSAVKGSIYSQLPEITIVDISHEIQAFDIFQASYIIKNSYMHFPAGTIHIIGVNAQPDINTPYIAIEYDQHYFIGADNGIFSLIFDKIPTKIVELNIKGDPEHLTFPTKDIFVKAACHIARGGTLEVIGTVKETFLERTLFRPVIETNMIRGTVIYIDSYQNIICNITNKLFKEVGKGRPFVINGPGFSVEQLSNSYSDVVEGEILALFNSADYLELAMNKGDLGSMMNLKLGTIITIRFQ